MKVPMLLMVVACLQLSARAQTVSLSLKEAPLEKAFKEIKRQTGYSFVYTRLQIQQSQPITIEVTNADIKDVLEVCFRNQPLTFLVEGKYVVVQTKAKTTQSIGTDKESISVTGKVVNEHGDALQGVTVMARKSGRATSTNELGEFRLDKVDEDDVLIITTIGYSKEEIPVNKQASLIVRMKLAVGNLDEMVVMAYGKTSKRLNTGNISKVSSNEIAGQPVNNPIAALEGRVPGLIITQANGYSSSPFTIELRGRNSIAQGTQPFIIIDGVPFTAQNTPINQLTNASAAGVNPFYTINPNDIESIEVLKDADATAIYGSRGANGVILITTKKGMIGNTKYGASLTSGWSKVTRTIKMLSTQDYVSMRKEAFLNDNIVPTITNAPDILVWDTTRNTDLQALLIGNTARTSEANLFVSGGTISTQFHITGAYHRESTVLPTDLADNRATVHASINHSSLNKRFSINMSTLYSYTRNSVPSLDPATFINRPPNLKLFDSSGKLNWQEGGVPYSSISPTFPNPFAIFASKYQGNFNNLNSNVYLSYGLIPGIKVDLNLGYSFIYADEFKSTPSVALNPFSGDLPNASFATSSNSTWIVEPQLEYYKYTNFGKFSLLLGATWQKSTGSGFKTDALNYQNDLLLGSTSGAGYLNTRNYYNTYKYDAGFFRLSYSFKDKYVANITSRRDGSSRFGPERRFSNFAAVGAAWIFSAEKPLQKYLPWLSFGKIRASYGTTGSDAIGDYRFMDTWTASTTIYQGTPILQPTSLFNPKLAWELTRKLEMAADFGFLNQRLSCSFAYYRNRSSNQLVSYALPIQTGFASIDKNQDALIQNSGFEISLETQNISTKSLQWSSNILISITRNKLIDFPNLENSSYASSLIVGEPVSIKKVYKFLGVDPATGLYTLFDANGNGSLNSADRVLSVNTTPKYFGGFNNILKYKNVELSVFIQFVRQLGLNYLGTLAGKVPGNRYYNQPAIVLDRWTKAGQVTPIQKFTTFTSSAGTNIATSDAAYSDASFIRCKTISLGYDLTKHLGRKLKANTIKAALLMQNLFTLTKYIGSDPENQNMYRLPPLKTVSLSLQLNL